MRESSSIIAAVTATAGIWKGLADEGVICAPDRVRRIMAERGLKALQPKTYVPQTSDGRAD